MAIRYKIFAAALLCGAVGFTAPSFAATVSNAAPDRHPAVLHHSVKHSVARAVSSRRLERSSIDLMERQRTSELNRRSLVGVGPQAQDINSNDAGIGG